MDFFVNHKKNLKIFLIGLTSVRLGALEAGANLGNYMIIEPLVKYLKAEFSEFDIKTSLQLSDSFCERFGIVCKREARFWTYGMKTALTTAGDIFRVSIWWLLNHVIGNKAEFAIRNSELLREMYESHLIIDFSGDNFGENAGRNKFLEDCAEILLARILEKPVIMLAGSPGPFKSYWRKVLGKFVLNRVSLITNREPISTEILRDLGVKKSLLKTTACPAFLFEGKKKEEIMDILKAENVYLGQDYPAIGVIITSWNMPNPPFSKIPREEEELQPFIAMIKLLLDEIKAQIVLISHSNRLDTNGQLIHGPDFTIMSQLYEMLNPEKYGKKLILLNKPYDTATMKGIIGCFDMLISGRLHGSISGLSQSIPTAIIDYGHEPKAHKLRGVARLLGLEEYVCDPTDAEQMAKIVSNIWMNRVAIQGKLSKEVDEVKKQARLNFRLLRDFTE